MSEISMSAVICTRNRPCDLRTTLTSLAWQDRRCGEVLVIDDSDPDRRAETRDVCERFGATVRLLVKDEPGLTASRNLAIEEVRGDVTMFFDDDVVLRPDFVRRILEAFEADPHLVGAGGSIDDDHDYELPSLRGLLMIPGRTTGRVYRSGWSSQSPRAETRTVEHLIGCNMAYRTEVLRRYRFHEDFRGYALGEDLEFSHRLHRDGHRLTSVGDARLWHLTSVPRHDRAWGYRETVIRPVVAGERFNRLAFLVSALAFAGVNAIRNRERAAGNVSGIRDVLRGRTDLGAQTTTKHDATTAGPDGPSRREAAL